MLAFVLKDGPPRRVACTNAATYTFLWPSFFTSAVPGARPLCRSLARRGAAAHGGLRLRVCEDSGRCCIVATRTLPAGTPLVSLPLSLSLSAAAPIDRGDGAIGGPLEELTGLLVRHLNSPRSPHLRYLEFLHDWYNADEDDVWFGEGSGPHAQLSGTLDVLYNGNVMHMKGADNAPFLDKDALHSPSQRVEWIRAQDLVRRVEQSVPHFAAKASAWGLSMALARGFTDDNGGISMYPLLDFCGHSYDPNTAIHVSASPEENRRIGVKWHDDAAPCVHLVARKAIKVDEPLTRMYSDRPVDTREDAEYWQMRWGFVPPAQH